ncbi:MAG: hypothetical protein JWN86_3037 [Planctomycetota bacterium]|nr:hypothetical protein [Planctomycetota bacterium]
MNRERYTIDYLASLPHNGLDAILKPVVFRDAEAPEWFSYSGLWDGRVMERMHALGFTCENYMANQHNTAFAQWFKEGFNGTEVVLDDSSLARVVAIAAIMAVQEEA